MPKMRILPDKCKILSGSAIKLIAVITMLIDHIGGHLVPRGIILFHLGSFQLPLYLAMRYIGRLAFPLFAFLLVEGFVHTRSRLRYGVSLLVCALISELPWNLLHGGVWHYSGQNVFFTLLLGYLALCGMDWLKSKPVLPVLALLAGALVTLIVRADYGVAGYAFILLLYALRESEVLRPFTSFVLPSHWFVLAAFVPVSLYNGKRGFIRGPVLKYAFYAFYPVHIFIIYLIKYRVLF